MRLVRLAQLSIILLWCSTLISCTPQSDKTLSGFAPSVTPIPKNNTLPTPPITSELINGCIPPLKTFVYKTRNEETMQRPGKDLIILPQSPWQIEAELPLSDGAKGGDSEVIQTRLINGHTEIWTGLVSSGEIPSYTEGFSVYYPDTNVWKEIPAQIGDDSKVYVSKLLLFVAKDGSLWGVNFWNARQNSLKDYPLLSKYNEKTERFEFDQYTKGIPAGWYSDGFSFVDDKILLDANGIFWFLVPKDAIYSYNPSTHEVKRRAEISDHEVWYGTIAPDGKIYYVIVAPPPQKGLFYFDPETDDVKGIDLTYSVYDTSYLPNVFSDHSGNLWLGGLGWMDANTKVWYRLHPSPIFIGRSSEDPTISWQDPSIFMESSDKRLWFRSNNGLAWLDLQKEQWCWFTTYQSNIVEDQEHNLWMIADGKLYKYPLKP